MGLDSTRCKHGWWGGEGNIGIMKTLAPHTLTVHGREAESAGGDCGWLYAYGQ
jgi:hypothetical protein